MKELIISGRTKIIPQEVMFCEADINYTRIHSINSMVIVPVSLKNVAKKLEEFSFIRIHRSYLINVKFMTDNYDRFEVEMLNKRSLTISRRKESNFRKLLKQNKNSVNTFQ